MNCATAGKVISVVIPTYKSEPNLPFLIDRLTNVLCKCTYEYEVVFVNDDSPDNSLNVLRDICAGIHTSRSSACHATLGSN